MYSPLDGRRSFHLVGDITQSIFINTLKRLNKIEQGVEKKKQR